MLSFVNCFPEKKKSDLSNASLLGKVHFNLIETVVFKYPVEGEGSTIVYEMTKERKKVRGILSRVLKNLVIVLLVHQNVIQRCSASSEIIGSR